jgi:hypothetical protein
MSNQQSLLPTSLEYPFHLWDEKTKQRALDRMVDMGKHQKKQSWKNLIDRFRRNPANPRVTQWKHMRATFEAVGGHIHEASYQDRLLATLLAISRGEKDIEAHSSIPEKIVKRLRKVYAGVCAGKAL